MEYTQLHSKTPQGRQGAQDRRLQTQKGREGYHSFPRKVLREKARQEEQPQGYLEEVVRGKCWRI